MAKCCWCIPFPLYICNNVQRDSPRAAERARFFVATHDAVGAMTLAADWWNNVTGNHQQ